MRSKPCWWLMALVLLTATAAPMLGQPQFAGAEFRVNGDTNAILHNPAVAFSGNGNAMVVWEDAQAGLRGRLYDSNGNALSAELSLVANQILQGLPAHGTETIRKDAAVAFLPGGDFIVAWTEERDKVSVDILFESRQVIDRNVIAQKFSAAGAPQGTPARLNASAAGYQSLPKILVRSGQDPFVVWQTGDGIFGRAFRPEKSKAVGSEVKISSGAGGNAAIAGDAAGNFLVSWEAADRSSQGVYARLFDKSASARGGEFLVNSTVEGLQRRPAVTAVKAGGWFVVWQGQGATAKDAHVYGQFLGGGGSFIGPEFRISQGVGPTQVSPAVAQVANGNFVVAWTDWKEPFPIGVFSVELDQLGNARGAEAEVNTRPIGSQVRTALAAFGSTVLIPWEGFTDSNTHPGISARRLTF
jgi:large repetitive protein